MTEHALAAHRRLAAVLEGLTDEQVAGPSALPGWTRGHVLAHLAGVTAALARQAECEGTKVEVYDGGRAGRDAAIEEGATRSAEEHRAAIAGAVSRLEKAWQGVRNWGEPVTHRDSTLRDTTFAMWREVVIHTHDLDLGPVEWTPEFRDHVVEFLTPRVPAGIRLTLNATDGPKWTIGEGEHVELAGTATDLVVWLAGREPAGRLTGEPPALDPWP